ncbi:MAG: ATP-binding protein [Lachnospiraceae bacterium]|nr:ATP-binding protein [Lachnospiraceae bacterium]
MNTNTQSSNINNGTTNNTSPYNLDIIQQAAANGDKNAQALLQNIENLWNITENARASAETAEHLSISIRNKDTELDYKNKTIDKLSDKLAKSERKDKNFSKRPLEIKKLQEDLYICNGSLQKKLCPNFIQKTTVVFNHTSSTEKISYLLLLTNTKLGQIYIDPRILYTKKLIDKLKLCAGFKTPLNDVSTTQLTEAFSRYITDENNHEDICTIYDTCGWHNKQYFCLDLNDNTWIVLSPYINPKTMLTKKSLLKTDTAFDTKTLPKQIDNPLWIWSCTYLGSLVLSLLLEHGLPQIPIVCMNQTEHTETFIHKFLAIWEDYQSQCSSSRKKEIEACIFHACDEPLILYDTVKTSTSENNMREITTSISTHTSCMNKGKLKAIPFVASSNILEFGEKYKAKIIPLIPDKNSCPSMDSRIIGADFISWIEKNYDDIIILLKSIQEQNISDATELFFSYMVPLCACYYHRDYGSAILAHVQQNDDLYFGIVQDLTEYCHKFEHFTLDSFRSMFLEEFCTQSRNQIKAVIHYQTKNIDNTIYYGKNGDCYIHRELFTSICHRLGFMSSHSVLQQLHRFGAIESENNGNNKITYVTKSNPLNKRMIHFYPDELIPVNALERSGFLFKEGIFIGKNPSGMDIYIPNDPMHPAVANVNTAITGKPGSGKSTFAKKTADTTAKQGVPVLYIDYTNDISEDDSKKYHTMTRYTLQNFPINPLEAIAGSKKSCAKITDTLTMLLHLKSEESDVLIKAISHVAEEKKALSFDSVTEYLEKEQNQSVAQQIIEKLAPYTKMDLFVSSNMTWKDMLYNNTAKFHVLKFDDSFSPSERNFLTELILTSFTDWIMTAYNKHEYPRPVMILLDEIRHLSFKRGMPLRTLLQEGRGHGCMVTAITQSIVELDNDQRDILMGAGYQIHFRQTANAKKILAYYAKDWGLPEDDLENFKLKACKSPIGHAFAYGVFSDTGEPELWEIDSPK